VALPIQSLVRSPPFKGLLAAVLLAIVVVAGVGSLVAGGGAAGRQVALCRPNLDPHLTPVGTGPAAFTMGIRVNRASDVDEIQSEFGDRVLPRDVFVINTEFPHSKPSDWEGALERISEKFRCNRIVTLTGPSLDPNRPSYEYALVGHPELDAVLVDWEPDSYEGTGRGAWTPALQANVERIDRELRQLAGRLGNTRTRMGLVPDYTPRWDYAAFGRVVAGANLTLDPIHRGYQIVQTQPNCGTPSAPGPLIGGLTTQLRSQYRRDFGIPLVPGSSSSPDFDSDLLQHLGFEVAFDETPNPKASEAVERLGPEQAAACTGQILRAGGGGVLYWASPDSIRALLDTPLGRSLRGPGVADGTYWGSGSS
jgi:hypothetical protein